jgi:hypothetical protein
MSDTYRWYQVARDATHEFEFDSTDGPKPVRVWERSIVSPDIRTFLCEFTPSSYVDVLDYTAEFDEEVSDEVREEWDMLLNHTSPVEGYYVHYRDVFDEQRRPKWRHVEQGEDTEEAAREYAQGNHII